VIRVSYLNFKLDFSCIYMLRLVLVRKWGSVPYEEPNEIPCERCEREFLPNRIWQRFCSRDCQQKWNHDRYRTQRVELGQMLRDKLTVTEGIVEPLIER